MDSRTTQKLTTFNFCYFPRMLWDVLICLVVWCDKTRLSLPRLPTSTRAVTKLSPLQHWNTLLQPAPRGISIWLHSSIKPFEATGTSPFARRFNCSLPWSFNLNMSVPNWAFSIPPKSTCNIDSTYCSRTEDWDQCVIRIDYASWGPFFDISTGPKTTHQQEYILTMPVFKYS